MIEFAQPLALWTGVALALPILAHLAYRRIAHKLRFSSLRFIRPSSIPRSGRRKPSDFLLLLLRVLIFSLITLLLADPYWREAEKRVSPPTEEPEYLFLLDMTPSMSGWGAWKEAQSEIRARLKNHQNGTFGFITHLAGEMKEFRVGTPVPEIEGFLEEIIPQSSPNGLHALIKRAPQLFSSDANSKSLVIFSDFQKSTWQEIGADFANNGISIELFEVGHGKNPWQNRPGNCAILDTRVVPGDQGKINVWSALRNFDENRTDLNVSIIAGGAIRDTVEIMVPPQGTSQVHFTLPSNDFAQAVVSIDRKDPLMLDNNQSLWILPPLPRTFGFWKRFSEDSSDLLESQFFRAAMESAGEGHWDSWREDDEKAKEMRIGAEGSRLDLLLVLGLSGWFDDEGLAPILHSYLERGGKVFISPPEDSHILMNKALRQPGLIDFRFGGINRTALRMEPYRIEVLPEDSKLNQVFHGDSARDLYLAQIRQFIRVQKVENLEVPIFDRSGNPLVLSQAFPNGGKLVFFTFRMLPEWTDLPLRNSFLPLLIELGELNQREDSLKGTVRLEAGDTKEVSGAYFDSGKIGLFQVGEKRIEVVHPLVESMPEVMNKNELLDALMGGHSSSVAKTADGMQKTESAKSLWLWFALCLAILLIVEMILSAPYRSTLTRKEVVSG